MNFKKILVGVIVILALSVSAVALNHEVSTNQNIGDNNLMTSSINSDTSSSSDASSDASSITQNDISSQDNSSSDSSSQANSAIAVQISFLK